MAAAPFAVVIVCSSLVSYGCQLFLFLIPHKDVEIRITGLREGEKMIEELYTDEEGRNLEKTDIEGVFSVKNHEKRHIDIAKVLNDLERMLENGPEHEKIKGYLKQIFSSLV